MKALTDRVCGTQKDAWGRDTYSCAQTFEIEAQDAGPRNHYRGHNHAVATVNVGDKIIVYTDNTGWTCWVFAS